jgi:hypothetical protein
VELQLASYRRKTGRLLGRVPQALPAVTEWGDLATLRALRQPGFG